MQNKAKNVLLLTPFIVKNDFKIYDVKFNPCFDTFTTSDIDGNLTFYKHNKTTDDTQVKKIKAINPAGNSIMSISYSLDGQGK